MRRLARDALGFLLDQAVFDALRSVDAVLTDCGGAPGGAAGGAGGAGAAAAAAAADARSRFLADGGSGGGSVLAGGATTKTSTTTLVEESAATAPPPARTRSATTLAAVCDTLYYEGQPDGAAAVHISEIGALLASGGINEMTLVFSDVEVCHATPRHGMIH